MTLNESASEVRQDNGEVLLLLGGSDRSPEKLDDLIRIKRLLQDIERLIREEDLGDIHLRLRKTRHKRILDELPVTLLADLFGVRKDILERRDANCNVRC